MDDRWRDAAASYIEKDQGNEMIVIFWSSDSKWEIVRVCGARTLADVKFKDSEVLKQVKVVKQTGQRRC